MNVAGRGIRNAFRNALRTSAIVVILGLAIGLSLVMLVAHQAVENKISTTLSAVGNTINIAPAGFQIGSDVNNALTSAQLAKVARLPHVTDVTEMLNDHLQTAGTTSRPTPPPGVQGTIATVGGSSSENATTSLKSPVKLNVSSNGSNTTASGGGVFFESSGDSTGAVPQLPSNFSLPIAIVGSNQPTNPAIVGASTLTITGGKAINGDKDTDDAMISKAMAAKNNLKVGSTFTAYTTTLTVAAIFDSHSAAGDGNIIVSLPTEQRLSGQAGTVTNAVATSDSLTNLNSVTAAIKKELGSSADVTSNIAQADQALQPLDGVKNVSLYSLIGAVAAGSAIILFIMILIVRERKREIGVLKAIGFSNKRIMSQFMVEALTLTVVGAIAGLVLGVTAGSPVTNALVSNNTGNSSDSGLPPGSGSVADGGGSFSVSTVKARAGGPTTITGDIQDVHADIGWTIILDGLGAAIIIALVGSGAASFFVAKVKPAEVLRSE